MIALYIIGGLALLILLILLLPIRGALKYSAEGFTLDIRYLSYVLAAIPGKQKGKLKKLVKEALEKRGGLVKPLLAVRIEIFQAIGKLFSGIRVKELKVWYLAAADNAAEAALQFGKMQAGLGAITGALENIFTIKKRDYRVDVSFEKTEPEVYIEARMILPLYRLIAILFGMVKALVEKNPLPVTDAKEALQNKKGGSVNG